MLTESVLSQHGKGIHYLAIHTDGQDLDKTELHMLPKVLIRHNDVLGPWTKLQQVLVLLSYTQSLCNIPLAVCK